MEREIINEYILAKRGKKNLKIALHKALKENQTLNNKFVKLLDKNTELKVIAEKLKVMGIVVEILARANGLQIIYTTSGTYVIK